MARFSIRNLGLKMLSICIAALLWLVVAGERVVERVLRVPVELQNLPPGLEVISNPPETVEVRVRGSSGSLGRMVTGDVSVVIDLRAARTGRRLFHLTPTQVSTPYGMEAVHVAPATLTMDFETTGVRVIRVVPTIDGEPARGYEIVSVVAEPPTVEVSGPESVLMELQEALTEPVLVDGQTATVREVVTVGVTESSVRVRSPQTTTVTVTIAEIKP